MAITNNNSNGGNIQTGIVGAMGPAKNLACLPLTAQGRAMASHQLADAHLVFRQGAEGSAMAGLAAADAHHVVYVGCPAAPL